MASRFYPLFAHFVSLSRHRARPIVKNVLNTSATCQILCQKKYSSDEAKAAAAAAEKFKKSGREPTIFSKILDRSIPADIIYEDDQCVAFRDINPVAPTHIVLIPRKCISRISEVTPDDEMLLGHLMLAASKVAEAQNLTNGYRIVINDGKQGCQSVYHLHIHIIGGRQMEWPPG